MEDLEKLIKSLPLESDGSVRYEDIELAITLKKEWLGEGAMS